jgi:ditrans,polycis-polyprenyl diphosphate synthase
MCGIRVVTIYAFSIENFKRSKSEVNSIMELAISCLLSSSERGGLLDRHGVALRVLGRLDLLEPHVLSAIQRATDLTRENRDKILNICGPYTSRDEIAAAIRQTVADHKIPVELSRECQMLSPEAYTSEIIKPQSANTKIWKQESFCSGSLEGFRDGADKSRSNLVLDSSTKRSFHFISPPSLCNGLNEKSVNVRQSIVISPQNITTKTLTDRMFTADNPPLDLLIRTSGVCRLSDFLLWQCHQGTRIMFIKCLWPDFGPWQFFYAIREWQRGKHKLMNENRKVHKGNSSNINEF